MPRGDVYIINVDYLSPPSECTLSLDSFIICFVLLECLFKPLTLVNEANSESEIVEFLFIFVM